MERIWIYQADREFTEIEEQIVLDKLEEFTMQWKAHGQPLAASADIRYHRFIVIAVDQSYALPSGCSIDKSVRLLKELEDELNIDFFDRMQIAYRDGDQIVVAPRVAFEKLIAEGLINADTVVFNNLVANKEELNTQWEVPFKNSWHAKIFQLAK
ncbi:ABC transporter ATPase [Olivibacter sp. SDN3]|uniref:ABC transporter ATPase n=1 Tax=Olivibacter sp. SDN3 TaxID=2764720 RepID=UPI001651469C|nr:ABC transporter ATPase [Olivibacter sp. SDN3]QNL52241.1 ABC transporter ATPase [Olivibacter sp. SDN3]